MRFVVRSGALLSLVALLGVVDGAPAQAPQRGPRIGYAYPAGGRQGTAFRVTLGGQFLEGASALSMSGEGVEAIVVEHTKPLTAMQILKLREQLKELQDRRTAARPLGKQGAPKTPPAADREGAPAAPRWTADDEKRLQELRVKIAGAVRRPATPTIAEQVTLQVTIRSDAKPGDRELRLKTPQGLTNPLVFCVGQLPESLEKDPVAKPPSTVAKQAKVAPGAARRLESTQRITDVEIPTTVNGQILPGGVDRFRFTARQGRNLVVVVRARQLIPYLSDAVPGWFQATVTLYDGEGREVAYADDFRFQPDPVLHYEIPADGRYVIEIKDSIYRGREDFIYRITLGELALATGLFPLGGPAGVATRVEVSGWNLPESARSLQGTPKSPGLYPLAAGNDPWISNPLPFVADTLPECLEKEPNNEPAQAQSLALPIIVNGRIDRPSDADVFRFEGKAGAEIVAEVYARRLNSPLDSTISLKDAAGRTLAANDDHEDKAAGLLTHHADSWLQTKLPADGAYYLHLGDSQHKGGPEYAYRLRIGPPRPDFELRVVPSSVNARAGTTVPITIYAVRRDGFAGEIALQLNDAPRGFALEGARIPAGQDRVRLTLTVPAAPEQEIVALRMSGRGTIDGSERVHPAVPADDMMQAFAYHHLVPAQEWKIAVSGSARARRPLRLADKGVVKLPRGGTARVRVNGPAAAMLDRIELELSEPPEGLGIQAVSPTDKGVEIVFQVDAAKAKPGLAGNLIVIAYAKRGAQAKPAKPAKPANLRGAPLTALPAIPFLITE